MKVKIEWLVVFFILALLLIGCNSQLPLSTPSAFTIGQTKTIQTSTDTYTSTIKISTTSITPTVSSTSNESMVTEICPSLSQSNSLGQIKGALLLSGVYTDGTSPFLMNIPTGQQYNLPQVTGYTIRYLAISPDRSHIAYTLHQNKGSDQRLIILSADHQSSATIPMELTWGNYIWLDNQTLIIAAADGSADVNSTVFLNPFTGKQEEFSPEYLGVSPSLSHAEWGFYSGTLAIYDPSLTYVAYSEYSALTIKSLPDKKLINQFFNEAYGGRLPKLSPDGKGFSIITNTNPDAVRDPWYYAEDFSYISWDGQSTRLSYLSDLFHSITILDYNWSPNGDQIAFWMSDDAVPKSESYRLGILDTKTGNVSAYCPTGDPYPDYLHYERSKTDWAPIWSPDGKQLLFPVIDPSYKTQALVYDPNKRDHTLIYILDIASSTRYLVARDLEPVGWITQKP